MKTTTKIIILILAVFCCVFCFKSSLAAMSWQAQSSGTSYDLTSVSFANNGIGLAGGYNQSPCVAVLKRTSNYGQTWEDAGTVPSFTCGLFDSTKVSTYLSGSNIYASAIFDSNAQVGHYFSTDNLLNLTSSWTDTDLSDPDYYVHGVKQAGIDNIFTVGISTTGNASTFYRNSTSLTNTLGLAKELDDIDCIGTSCWVAGVNAMAYKGDSDSFTSWSMGSTYLYGIDMVTSSLGYTVGNSGAIYKCSSNNCSSSSDWTSLSSGITGDLYDISCPDASTCIAVGGLGKIYRTTNGGTTWTEEQSGTTQGLVGVSFPQDQYHGYAVGENGTIISYLDIIAPTTTVSPNSGTYSSPQTVTLTTTDAESGVVATYYTLDGTTPTASSTLYTAPITIDSDTTLEFFSVDNAGNEEAIQTATYQINSQDQDNHQDIYFQSKIILQSSYLNKNLINRKNNVTFKFSKLPKHPKKYWLKLKKVKQAPKKISKSLHYYTILTTNLYKYKGRIKVNIYFSYKTSLLKKYNLKVKNLYLAKYNSKTKQWQKNSKAKHSRKNKWLKLKLTKFKTKTSKYAIVSK